MGILWKLKQNKQCRTPLGDYIYTIVLLQNKLSVFLLLTSHSKLEIQSEVSHILFRMCDRGLQSLQSR